MQHRYRNKKVYFRPVHFEVLKLQNMVKDMHENYVRTQIGLLRFLIKQYKKNDDFYESFTCSGQTIRLSRGNGLCANLSQGLYYPEREIFEHQRKIVEYLFTTWEDFSGLAGYPIITWTKKLRADQLKLLTNFHGRELSKAQKIFLDKKYERALEQFSLKAKYSGTYGKQRLKLAQYMLECFEQLELVNQP